MASDSKPQFNVSKLTEQTVATLKKEHGDELTLVPLGGVEFVLRLLLEPDFQKFMDGLFDDKKKSSAVQKAARAAIVFPPAAERDAVFEKKPGYLLVLGNKALEIAGMNEEVEAKKL